MARLASNLSPHLLQHPRLQEIVSPLFFLREAHFYGNEMTPVLWLNRNFRDMMLECRFSIYNT